MKKSILFLLTTLMILSFSNCSGGKKVVNNKSSKNSPVGNIQFIKSGKLFDVLDQAEAENKLVFVDFYTDWCLPCKLMDEEVFNDKEIARFMNKNFINYKINVEKGNGANVAAIYEVSAYPTLIFMDGKGRVLERKTGAAFHTELKNMANRALDSAGIGH